MFILGAKKKSKKRVSPRQTSPIDFPETWKAILNKKVAFYAKLSETRKPFFEKDVARFLNSTQITGVGVAIDDTDRLLVASGAIIPIFEFPDWEYQNLYEVIIYPGLFTEDFRTEGPGRSISGMVGRGAMEGKMLLSKKSLHLGFDNRTDKKNVAVHEFIHLVDKADGAIDGIPSILMDREYALPWMELIREKMEEINADDSDINSYGGTSVEEFFPVVSEYFFERPKLLKRKHPELYKILNAVFKASQRKR